MVVSIIEESKFVDCLTEHVLSKLSGKHVAYEEVKERLPSKEIIIGTLCSKLKAQKGIEEPKKSSVNTNSLSVSFLMSSLEQIKVRPILAVYFNRKDKTYKKYSLNLSQSILSIDNQEEIVDFGELKKLIAERENVSEKELPTWSAKVRLDINKYTQKNKQFNLITVTLENTSMEKDKQDNQEFTLFNASLEINLDKELTPFVFNYEYEGYSESYETPFQCINCSAEYFHNVRTIKTGLWKKFYQPSLKPNNNLITLEGEEFPINISELIEIEKRNKFLDKICFEMERYSKFYEEQKPPKEDMIFDKYINALDNFKDTITRFRKGIEVLKRDKIASKSFELLQKTFENASKYKSWRLFQLIFIISNIPGIIYKNENNITEVLHVDTGGGKSEAYFGLIIFASFFDRLSGKIFGITGITKFPLRMLSIQQLERVASIFIWAEEIRNIEKIGGHPFSVAYFVGNSNEFPRYNDQMILDLQNRDIRGKIVRTCPLCKREEVYLHHNKEDSTVIHRCAYCKKDFFLYLTDEEVFRKLPTFIIATVDKFSGIAQNRRYRNLFGGKLCTCTNGHGFIPAGDICEANNKQCDSKKTNAVKTSFNQGPSIIIQDEMHLIKEGFGTIDSHFESFMENLQEEFQNEGFKNIAMTATVSGAKNQIMHLYAKDARVFPGSSPLGKGKKDFFFTLNEKESQRLLVGLKPNGEENRKAIRLTLDHAINFISEVEKNKKEFCDKESISPNNIDELLTNYKSYLSYHSKKDDVQSLSNLYQYMEEKEYKIKPIVLTGDLSLDEIRDIIINVNKQNTLDTKEILNVCATSVVSHGVDIEKWNLMCFQGMPRSTAEYIQSLSRVGRQHVGIVFMWFYPNRIRDLSFFNKFEEYHKMINHHVNPVPILRWARLGFNETFNSLFCAAILNYFPNKIGKPIYKVAELNKLFSEENAETNRKELIDFIRKAYKIDKNQEECSYFEDNINSWTEERINFLIDYKGSKKDFFPAALMETNDIYFKNQSGMRGIQKEVLLRPEISEIEFVNKFKLNQGDKEDE